MVSLDVGRAVNLTTKTTMFGRFSAHDGPRLVSGIPPANLLGSHPARVDSAGENGRSVLLHCWRRGPFLFSHLTGLNGRFQFRREVAQSDPCHPVPTEQQRRSGRRCPTPLVTEYVNWSFGPLLSTVCLAMDLPLGYIDRSIVSPEAGNTWITRWR